MKRLIPSRPRLRVFALLVLSVGLVAAAGAARVTAAGSPPPGLLLWNKLGSAYEVTHSEVGPNLVFFDCASFACGIDVPGTFAYPAGVFGGAASVSGGPYSSQERVHAALLHDTILNPEHGAVEAWYRQTSDPVPYVHNPHRIFGGPYSLPGVDEVNLFSSDLRDTGDPRLHFRVFFGASSESQEVYARSLVDGVEGYPISSLNGTWIHVAGVWDRGGIDGSADTVRLYVNGVLVAAAQASDWGTTQCASRPSSNPTSCYIDVAGCNDTCADTFAVDNLKVWDYAKTDYGDRFEEGFDTTNRPPDCSGVSATPASIWPQTRDQMKTIALSGATDPDGDALSYHVDGLTQDEPVSGVGDDTSPDAALTGAGASSSQVLVRAEASSQLDGRVYRIAYTVSDGKGGTCSGTAKVGVQRKKGVAAVDGGDTASWNSFTGARLP